MLLLNELIFHLLQPGDAFHYGLERVAEFFCFLSGVQFQIHVFKQLNKYHQTRKLFVTKCELNLNVLPSSLIIPLSQSSPGRFPRFQCSLINISQFRFSLVSVSLTQ